MNKLLQILLVTLLFPYNAEASPVVGLHTISLHSPSREWQNNSNFGLYYRDQDITIGAYRNTLHRNALYLGYSVHYGPFSLMIGGITGYKKQVGYQGKTLGNSEHVVSLMAAPSVVLPKVLGTSPRITFIPGIGSTHYSVFHLSLEWGR